MEIKNFDKLEIGKYYKDRDGLIFKVIKINDTASYYNAYETICITESHKDMIRNYSRTGTYSSCAFSKELIKEIVINEIPINNDKLFELFDKQIKLQIKLGNQDYIRNQSFIIIMSLALIDEIMESIRETPWKPWKQQQIFHEEEYKKELVDAWHFLINLTLASGMDSNELYKRFLDKNKENIKRKDEGY